MQGPKTTLKVQQIEHHIVYFLFVWKKRKSTDYATKQSQVIEL